MAQSVADAASVTTAVAVEFKASVAVAMLALSVLKAVELLPRSVALALLSDAASVEVLLLASAEVADASESSPVASDPSRLIDHVS